MSYKMSGIPLISVIVPNYNNGEWIRDCFDSILHQTYKKIEAVIIDDASTDDSPDIIRLYQNNHPHLFSAIFLDNNVGVAAARHAGIIRSQGEYITTLDADDYYADERKLEKEMALIVEYKNKYNKDIAAFSNKVITWPDGSKSIQGNEQNIVQGNIINHIMCRSCMIPRDFTFLKALYYEVGGYDESLITHEDWDLKIRLADKCDFYYTGINGTAYRRHNNGLSSTPYELRKRNLVYVFNKNIKLIKDKNAQKEIRKEFEDFLAKKKNNNAG